MAKFKEWFVQRLMTVNTQVQSFLRGPVKAAGKGGGGVFISDAVRREHTHVLGGCCARPQIDSVINEDEATRIVASLASYGTTEREILYRVGAITDAGTSLVLERLVRAEYVARDSRGAYALTPKGRERFHGHLLALKEIIERPSC
jgi:hypothetical protein